MNLQQALVLLTTETPLHVGVGQSIAGLDLPIQRETHTQWPCILGSSLKGALRAHAETRSNLASKANSIISLFGPSHGAAAGERDESHAGALMIGDAKIFLLPVRSLQSSFKWVTCPSVLNRFYKDVERLQIGLAKQLFEVKEDNIAIGNKEQVLFLEEFRLNQVTQQSEKFDELCKQIIDLTGGESDSRFLDIQNQLVIVHDDVFTFLSNNATSVNAHIAIDSHTKIVRNRALWYEESLPPDSLLYFPLVATSSRKKDDSATANDAIQQFRHELFNPTSSWLQVGGNETTGMGWCKVNIHCPSDAEK